MRFAVAFALALPAVLASTCSGAGRDLSELIGRVAPGFIDGRRLEFIFELSPCEQDVPCGADKGMVCQTTNCPEMLRPTVIATDKDIEWTATPRGAIWLTNTGENCNPGNGLPRVGNFEYVCNGGHNMTIKEDPAMPCVYNFLIEADCGNAGADPVVEDINPTNGTARGGTTVLVYGNNFLDGFGGRRSLLCAFGTTVSPRPARWIFDAVVECTSTAGRVGQVVPLSLLVAGDKQFHRVKMEKEVMFTYTA